MRQVRNYPPAVKKEAMGLVMEGNQSVQEVAKLLNINPASLYGWLQKKKNKPARRESATQGPKGWLKQECVRLKAELAVVERLLKEMP